MEVCITQGFGALVLGWFVKQLMERWLRLIHSDTVNSINVTVIMTYLAFCCGEVYLNVSGVLTVVTLGILMSKVGKTLMNK